MILQVDPGKYPTAYALIALWNRPWSSTCLRFASHRLSFILHVHGHVILDDDGKKPAGDLVSTVCS